jgi:hypothetical protein
MVAYQKEAAKACTPFSSLLTRVPCLPETGNLIVHECCALLFLGHKILKYTNEWRL